MSKETGYEPREELDQTQQAQQREHEATQQQQTKYHDALRVWTTQTSEQTKSKFTSTTSKMQETKADPIAMHTQLTYLEESPHIRRGCEQMLVILNDYIGKTEYSSNGVWASLFGDAKENQRKDEARQQKISQAKNLRDQIERTQRFIHQGQDPLFCTLETLDATMQKIQKEQAAEMEKEMHDRNPPDSIFCSIDVISAIITKTLISDAELYQQVAGCFHNACFVNSGTNKKMHCATMVKKYYKEDKFIVPPGRSILSVEFLNETFHLALKQAQTAPDFKELSDSKKAERVASVIMHLPTYLFHSKTLAQSTTKASLVDLDKISSGSSSSTTSTTSSSLSYS